MKTILTNMILVEKDGNVLLQDRKKQDWPGLNLPGGHVDENESIEDSVKRELKEETNLEALDIEFVSYFEWDDKENDLRHLAMLFKVNSFKGELLANEEGELNWYKISDIKNHLLSLDLDKVLSKYNININ